MSNEALWYAGKMIALSELFLELRTISRERFFERHSELTCEIDILGIAKEVNEAIVEFYLEPFQEESSDFC